LADTESCALFHELVWPHRALVLRYARIISGPQEADDLAQETLMRAFSAVANFVPGPDGSGVKAWLLRILRNLHTDRLRAASIRPLASALPDDLPARPIPQKTPDPADPEALLQSLSDQAVIDAMLSLPHDIRWTLLLTDVEEMDHSQAAAIMEIPVGTVKSRVSRGHAMLRERLCPVDTRAVSNRGAP